MTISYRLNDVDLIMQNESQNSEKVIRPDDNHARALEAAMNEQYRKETPEIRIFIRSLMDKTTSMSYQEAEVFLNREKELLSDRVYDQQACVRSMQGGLDEDRTDFSSRTKVALSIVAEKFQADKNLKEKTKNFLFSDYIRESKEEVSKQNKATSNRIISN